MRKRRKNLDLWWLMAAALAFVAALLLLSGCVTRRTYLHDVLFAYHKGLRVGHVIGRDEVLGSLKSPQCFNQSTDELLNPSPFDQREERYISGKVDLLLKRKSK